MAEDLANISSEYETLKNEVKTIPQLQQKLHVSITDIIVEGDFLYLWKSNAT